MTKDNPAGSVELGFFNRATSYRFRPVSLVAPRQAHWHCETGKEWSGTNLLFDLKPDGAKTALRFTHADWQAETDYAVSCTTVWGGIDVSPEGRRGRKNSGPALFDEWNVLLKTIE